MGLSDVMGHAGLSGYAVVAMVLFMAAFAVIVAWTFAPRRRRELDEASRLPLDDGTQRAERPGANP
jgi:cbb3-type cytochrome oxidase subunit 3